MTPGRRGPAGSEEQRGLWTARSPDPGVGLRSPTGGPATGRWGFGVGRGGPRLRLAGRWLRPAGAALVGLVVGVGVTLALQGPPDPPRSLPSPVVSRPPAPAATVPRPAAAADRVLLVWTPGRLPGGLAGAAGRIRGVRAVTVVRGGLLGLAGSVDADGRAVDRPRPGTSIPLEAIGFDPATYPALLPASARAAFARLGPGEALLGSTSARLRRLGPGGRLRLAQGAGRGRWLTVAGVVDDALVGAAEVAVTTAGARAVGITRDRYLLLAYRGGRAEVAAGLRRALKGGGLPVRLRGPGETPFFRAGDAVLPQALVKERFGEFAWRKAGGDAFAQDPAWQAANLVTARVPILGRVRCNRALLPSLAGAMGELRQRGLARLVDPAAYAGCWNPRLTRGGGGVSRHAWGAAVDLNVAGNPTGLASAQDPRLVEVMERWGFTWGGRWLVPDPAHFEWLRARPAAG
jgi:D-alanyl-D-alanine carboxypeptidase-like protein